MALQPKLKQATIETDALLDKIAVDTKDANEVEAVVSKERSVTSRPRKRRKSPPTAKLI